MTRATIIISDSDPGFRKLRRRLSGQPNFVDIGIFPDKSFDIVLKAAAAEFGVPGKNVPQRSFLRATIDINRERIIGVMKGLINDIMAGKMTMGQALDEIGKLVGELMKKRILGRIPPPNAPLTIARKGFDHPLIETTQMINDIKHRIGRAI